MKKNILRLIDAPVTSHVLDVFNELDAGNERLLRILTYHRVDDIDARPHLSPALLSATPELFDAQMAYIKKDFNPVGIEEVRAALYDGHTLPKKAILVTFDDAYVDFQQQALPILKRYNIPSILFVPTAFTDNPTLQFWWDTLFHAINTSAESSVLLGTERLPLSSARERKTAFKAARNYIKSLPHQTALQQVDEICEQLAVAAPTIANVLSWDDLSVLANDDLVTLAAHTRTHPLLNRVTVEDAVNEAIVSYNDLYERFGDIDRVFAYPSGAANEVLADALKQQGFDIALTTQRGINVVGKSNPLLLNRINMTAKTSVNLMRIQLLRTFGHAQNFWHTRLGAST